MPVDDALLQVHAAATAALAGLVWVVQLVVYPAFLIAVSVPLHTRLGEAYDAADAERLIRTNWARTAAWTAGAVVAAVLAARGAS